MDSTLKEQLIRTMMRFRKIGMPFPPDLDIRMGELMVMNGIAGHFPKRMHHEHNENCQFDVHRKIFVSDLQKMHHITKPAISQMLNGLEKKGYVRREMDKDDRRKITVTLTEPGKEILYKTKSYTDRMLDETIERYGEENLKQLISLFNRLIDVNDEIKKEYEQSSRKEK